MITLDKLQSIFPVHYRYENVLIINADSMDVMEHIWDDEFDLAIIAHHTALERAESITR